MTYRPLLAAAATIALCIPSLASAQTNDNTVRDWETSETVTLTTNIPQKRVYYTMQTRLAQIVMSYNDIMPVLYARRNAKYRDRILTSVIPQRLRAFGPVNMNMITQATLTDEYVLDLIVPLLDEGKIAIYDRTGRSYISSFTIHDYGTKLQNITLSWYREYLLPGGGVFYRAKLK